ncbi:MAG: hypothetical protein ACYTHM_11225 [Planctomycetota bacterium]|jgi:hypothetical protein
MKESKRQKIANIIERHEFKILVIVLMLIIIGIDVAIYATLFPFFEDRVKTSWHPLSGQRTTSLKAGILMVVDIALFAGLGYVLNIGLRRLKNRWKRVISDSVLHNGSVQPHSRMKGYGNEETPSLHSIGSIMPTICRMLEL